MVTFILLNPSILAPLHCPMTDVFLSLDVLKILSPRVFYTFLTQFLVLILVSPLYLVHAHYLRLLSLISGYPRANPISMSIPIDRLIRISIRSDCNPRICDPISGPSIDSNPDSNRSIFLIGSDLRPLGIGLIREYTELGKEDQLKVERKGTENKEGEDEDDTTQGIISIFNANHRSSSKFPFLHHYSSPVQERRSTDVSFES